MRFLDIPVTLWLQALAIGVACSAVGIIILTIGGAR